MSFWLNLNAAQILVIAKDFELSDFLHEILVEAGYNVQKAYTLDDARFMVGYTTFNLAVIDNGAIQDNPDAFRALVQDGLLFGDLAWIVVTESDQPLYQHLQASQVVNLLKSGYSPKSILSAVAQTLDNQPATSQIHTEAIDIDSDPTPDQEARKIFERKLKEHQTLSVIARLLNSTLDLTTVLTKVVDAATAITNADEGLLLLPDNDGKTLYIRAAKGIDSDTAKEFRIKTDDTLAGQVFKTGQAVLVGDAGWQKVKTEYFVKSLLYVPMMFKDTVIGVLGVNNRTSERTFSAHDRDILMDLASHAAIAIENARLYGESVTRSRELAILFTASQAVNSTLALDEVLKIICEQLIMALEIGWCEIVLFKDNKLRTLAAYQRAQWQIKQMTKTDQHQSPAMYQAIQNRQRIFLAASHIKRNSRDGQYLQDQKANLICMFPLVTEHRAIGVFELIYSHQMPKQFASPTLHVHQQAIQLMVAIDSVSINNIESQTIAQDLLTETGADFCTLHLWDESQQLFHKRWSFGQTVWAEDDQPETPISQYPILAEVLERGEMLNLIRDQESPQARQLLDAYQARAMLVLPLISAGEIIGAVLMVDTIRQRPFNQRKVDMASALGVQAANALKNAWLFRDLAKSLEHLRHAQGQLIQAARLSAMGELAAAVAHQINNPLTTVLADTQMMMEDMPPDDVHYEAVVAVNRSGKRAHEVVRRLLVMAHQGSENDPPQVMDVNETIQNTLTLVSKHIEQYQVAVRVELADNLPLAYGLSGQLEDVWMNLLLNARDAVRNVPQPTIGIRSFYTDGSDMVEVEVWDTGEGIPADKQLEIFDAFFTTKPSGEGTGLGLHICKKVVEKCRGEIRLKQSSAEGTIFLVRLPIK